MRKYFILFLLLVSALGLRAENASNVRMRQGGKSIIINKMKNLFILVLLVFSTVVFAQSNKSNLIRVNIQKETKPAILQWVDGSIVLKEPSGNNIIDAEEECFICFSVKNIGMEDAYNCIAKIEAIGSTVGITCENKNIPKIALGEIVSVELPIHASKNTVDGQVKFCISMYEPKGFGTNTKELVVSTRQFLPPKLRIVDYIITGENGNTLQKNEKFSLKLLLQNLEYGVAEYVDVIVSFPEDEGIFLFDGKKEHNFRRLNPGESKYLEYSMIVGQNYPYNDIPIEIEITEKYFKYAENSTINLHINQEIESVDNTIVIKPNELKKNPIEIESLRSDVDKNIPISDRRNDKTFAVIIANENYQNEANVPFALNDGKIFRQYCNQTLGIPEENIHYVADATLNNLRKELNWLKNVLQSYEGAAKAIFYYAGHGVPDESNKSAYLLPTDGFGADLTTGYLLDDLYSSLGSVNSGGITIFLDACFSGAKREGDMMAAARAIAIKVKHNVPIGNMVVFSAAQSDETAYQNDKEQHGMFTYFLLKKLQETGGNINLYDLGEYIVTNVKKRSIVLNGKLQTPSVMPSLSLGDKWKNWTLK